MQELPCQAEMLASNIQGGFIKFPTAVKGEKATCRAQPAHRSTCSSPVCLTSKEVFQCFQCLFKAIAKQQSAGNVREIVEGSKPRSVFLE